MVPKISVIVPVLNRERIVSRCLDSILRQSQPPYELIVVDNNSTDGTFNVVKEWMAANSHRGIKIHLLLQTIPGACAARQMGMEHAEGDFLSFFDSDDEMHQSLLETVSKKLEELPDSDIVCWKCRINLLDGSVRIPPFRLDSPMESHLIHTMLRPQGYIVKKEFLVKSGGWQKPVEVWNDFELGLRLLLNNPKITGVNNILAEIYSQENSITGKDFSSKRGKWEKSLKEMEFENEKINHPLKNRIRKILRYRMMILAAHYRKEGNPVIGSEVLKEALKGLNTKDKIILKAMYYYTGKGLRGAWRIINNIY